MKYIVRPTNQFQKDLKLAQRRGYNFISFKDRNTFWLIRKVKKIGFCESKIRFFRFKTKILWLQTTLVRLINSQSFIFWYQARWWFFGISQCLSLRDSRAIFFGVLLTSKDLVVSGSLSCFLSGVRSDTWFAQTEGQSALPVIRYHSLKSRTAWSVLFFL